MNKPDVSFIIERIRAGDMAQREDFIESNKGFIRRFSSFVCKRGLDWSNDDELSIGLLAFNEAIDSYNIEDGSDFFAYSKIIIKNRLIDYFRKNQRNTHISLNSLNDQELSVIENKEAIENYLISTVSEERTTEIKLFNKELSLYNLSMADLTLNCPKHRDTRKMLFEIAIKSGMDRNVVRSLKKNKLLPIKEIMDITGAKRKLLEKWRKYIIALIIIVSSDEYLYLKEYIDFEDREVAAD